MSGLWSPADGVTDRRPPFGVWVGDPETGRFPAPEAAPRPPRRPPPAPLLAVAAPVVTALVAGSVVAMVDRLGATPPPRPGPVVVPTLDSLNAAIARGEALVDGLDQLLCPR